MTFIDESLEILGVHPGHGKGGVITFKTSGLRWQYLNCGPAPETRQAIHNEVYIIVLCSNVTFSYRVGEFMFKLTVKDFKDRFLILIGIFYFIEVGEVAILETL